MCAFRDEPRDREARDLVRAAAFLSPLGKSGMIFGKPTAGLWPPEVFPKMLSSLKGTDTRSLRDRVLRLPLDTKDKVEILRGDDWAPLRASNRVHTEKGIRKGGSVLC